MTVGLYIPPELFAFNLPPIALLVAAEIHQFGPGKCHARIGHFERRFGRSKNTILDAFNSLRKCGILVECGEVKEISFCTKRSEIAPNGAEIERSEIAPVGSESEPTSSKIGPAGSEIGPPSKQEVKQEDNKKLTKNLPSACPTGGKKKSDNPPIWDRKNDPLWNPLFDAIVAVCHLQERMKWPKNSPAGLVASTTDLLRLSGRTAEQVLAFPAWFRQQRMGFKQPVPTVIQVRDNLHLSCDPVTQTQQTRDLFQASPSTVDPLEFHDDLPADLTPCDKSARIWAEAMGRLAEQDPEEFEAWLKPLRFLGVVGDRWCVASASRTVCRWAGSNYRDAIEAAAGVPGLAFRLSFLVRP